MIVMFILKLIVSPMLIMIPIVVALPKLYQSYIRVAFLSGRGDKTDFKSPFTVHLAIFGSFNCFVPVLGNFDAVLANKIRPLGEAVKKCILQIFVFYISQLGASGLQNYCVYCP